MVKSQKICCATILLVVLPSTGCLFSGPRRLRAGRADFNMAVQQTNSEELLLNLVRLKYRDSAYFMSVSNITSSSLRTASVTAGASITRNGADTYAPAATVGIQEAPTIVYQPLQGEQFVRAVMTPLRIEEVVLLFHSGWGVDRILRVVLQSMNSVPNAPTASGPTPDMAPEYKEFRELAILLRRLARRGLVELGQSTGPDATFQLIFTAPADDPDATRVRQILKLRPDLNSFSIVPGFGASDGSNIKVVLRSFNSVLSFLSDSIDTPVRDESSGHVTITKTQGGERFDWQLVFGNLLHIHTAQQQPKNAAVAVRYRGAWFYIEDSDLDSKSTFNLLGDIFAMQAGEIKTTAPVLTVPALP